MANSTTTTTTTATDIITTTPMTPIPPDPPSTRTSPNSTSTPTSKPVRTYLSHLAHQTLTLFLLLTTLFFILFLLDHLVSFYTALFTLPLRSKLLLLFHAAIAWGAFLIAVLVGDNLLGKELEERQGVVYDGRVAEALVVGGVWVNAVVGVTVWGVVVGSEVVRDVRGFGMEQVGWRQVMDAGLWGLKNVVFKGWWMAY